MKRLENKVALVTGSSKGIGAGIAKQFAHEGANVVVNYSSSNRAAEKVVNEITQNGGTAIAVQADISKHADIERLFGETKKAFDGLDVLVNNAGVWEMESLGEISEESFHKQVNTHLKGSIFCTQHAAAMFDNNGGSIINISSTMSINPLPGTMIYSAAKAGIDNVTKVLAKELGSQEIRINTLAPGQTRTEGNQETGITGSEIEQQMVDKTPLGRVGQAGDIAKVATFLASDEAGWVTGERISASGGLL